MRIREIIVLGSFAPITIFSTKFTDSLTGNAKLAGFSLTVTAIMLGGDDRPARTSAGSVRRVLGSPQSASQPGRFPSERGARTSHARTITLRRSPMPSTCTMVSSPGSRWPEAFGVPVMMTSPGSSVENDEIAAICSGMP